MSILLNETEQPTDLESNSIQELARKCAVARQHLEQAEAWVFELEKRLTQQVKAGSIDIGDGWSVVVKPKTVVTVIDPKRLNEVIVEHYGPASWTDMVALDVLFVATPELLDETLNADAPAAKALRECLSIEAKTEVDYLGNRVADTV